MSENQSGSMNGSLIGGFLLGAVIGAGVALLLAPASGTETRRRLAEGARGLKEGAQDKLEGVQQKVKQGASAVGAALHEGREAFRRSTAQEVPAGQDRS